MDDNRVDPVLEFFNTIAVRWDSWEDFGTLNPRLDDGLRRFGVGPAERVLDVGCGTGNLTAALLRRLSAEGTVVAVDLSPKMIEVARGKVADARVDWVCDTIERYNGCDGTFDRIFCYSVWPHFTDANRVALRLHALLVPGGKLHVWHLLSRKEINEIHAGASDAVSDHFLLPATQNAAILAEAGFMIEETIDDEDGYCITAGKVTAAG